MSALILVFWDKGVSIKKRHNQVNNMYHFLKSLNQPYQTYNVFKDKVFKKPYSHLIIMGSNRHPLIHHNPITSKIKKKVFSILDYFIKFNKPILGICYGCQLINLYFGGSLKYVYPQKKILYNGPHYNYLNIRDNLYIFRHFPNKFLTVFSNKYTVDVKYLPDNLEITSQTNKIISAIRDKHLPIYGCQFHPEKSGRVGYYLLLNFLNNN